MTEKYLVSARLKSHRDILLFEFERSKVIVIGCDSAGGIGPKPLDMVKVDGYTLGRFTARVALMEVLSTGAKPLCVVNTLSVELEPTGTEILRGVKEEARKAGLDPALAVTGSSEKNVPVKQTGIGVTVIGVAKKSLLKIGNSKPSDVIIAIGIPCFGEEVISAEKQNLIAEIDDLLTILKLNFVHEIVPVGSKGIANEIEVMAKDSHLHLKLNPQAKVNLRKSAGPATVILASLPNDAVNELKKFVNKPVNVVGYLYESP